MISIGTLKDGLYDFMDALCTHQDLDFTIQWAQDNQNKCDLPRIELSILSLPSVGTPIQLSPDDDGFATLVQESNFILRILAAGENSLALCTLLKMAQYVPEVIEDLREDTGLSILNSTEPTNVSGFNDQYVEERWTIDLTFTFAYNMEDIDVGVIEHIELTGELENIDGSLRTIPIFTVDKPA